VILSLQGKPFSPYYCCLFLLLLGFLLACISFHACHNQYLISDHRIQYTQVRHLETRPPSPIPCLASKAKNIYLSPSQLKPQILFLVGITYMKGFSLLRTVSPTEYTECQAFFPVVRNGPPPPSPTNGCCPPEFQGWGDTFACLRGCWRMEPIRMKGQTLWYSGTNPSTVSPVVRCSSQNGVWGGGGVAETLVIL
jgi:hypothetical protein